MVHMKLKSKTNIGTFNNLGYGWRWVTSEDNTTTPIQTLNNRAQLVMTICHRKRAPISIKILH
jgi:hypothetical protein